jgi:thioredoxin-like negative regulator of GroEL
LRLFLVKCSTKINIKQTYIYIYPMQFTPRISKFHVSDEFTRADFERLLAENPGKVVLKFGATWCGPCKRIEAHVNDWINTFDDSVVSVIIDIDESFDIYGVFKARRQVNGIPAILCFKKGNLSYIPDFSVNTSDLEAVNTFFKRVRDE